MTNEIEKVESKLYELGYHIIPTLSEGDFSAQVEAIKKVLADNKAEIVKEGEPKLIDLKYTMIKHIAGSNKRFGQAYFGWIKFNAISEAVEEIKVKIEGMDSVLRHLLVKTVDDDEHSTSKIEMAEGETGIEEAHAEEIIEEIEEVLEDDSEKTAKDSGQPETLEEAEKEVDEAIDELVK